MKAKNKNWHKEYEEFSKQISGDLSNLIIKRIPCDIDYGWINMQRENYRKGLLTNEQIELLKDINGLFLIDQTVIYISNLNQINNIYNECGTIFPVDAELNSWVRLQQNRLRKEIIENDVYEELNKTDIFKYAHIDSKWLFKYEIIKDFYLLEGHYDITYTLKHLGLSVLLFIKSNIKKYESGDLSKIQIELLSELGALNIKESYENNKFKHLSVQKKMKLFDEFVATHGHNRVPQDYLTPNGVKLGQWVGRARYDKSIFSPEKFKYFSSHNFLWDTYSVDPEWDNSYKKAYNFFNDNDDVILRFKGDDKEFSSYHWVKEQYKQYQNGLLDSSQVERMKKIKYDWSIPIKEYNWNTMFEMVEAYIDFFGHSNIKQLSFFCGLPFGDWVSKQKISIRAGTMRKDRLEKYKDISFDWENCFEKYVDIRIEGLYYFKMKHGHLNIPIDYKYKGILLRKWVLDKKKEFGESRLSELHNEKLQEIDPNWDKLICIN